jgi:predicted MPP superfamily phosphohydrolase
MIWISDTMAPLGAQVVEKLAVHEPDLVVHGGDIQYQSNPLDSWNGFFRYFQPLFAQAPVHFTIGNHEYEDYDEYDEIWVRLMGDQGDA